MLKKLTAEDFGYMALCVDTEGNKWTAFTKLKSYSFLKKQKCHIFEMWHFYLVINLCSNHLK